jgi:hypothetical protein
VARRDRNFAKSGKPAAIFQKLCRSESIEGALKGRSIEGTGLTSAMFHPLYVNLVVFLVRPYPFDPGKIE